jgi:hypothetical protein
MLLETILGGVTGLIGNIVGGIFKYKTAKLDMEIKKTQNAHEVAMVKAETQAMVMEAKANIAVTRAQVEGAVELADANVYLQSQREGNKNLFSNKWIDKLLGVQGKARFICFPAGVLIAVLFGLVDFLKGLMRPSLTAYLVALTTWVTWMAWQIINADGVGMDLATAKELFGNVTSIVVYLTVSCVTWWFGDRRMAKTIMQMQGADKTKIDDNIVI